MSDRKLSKKILQDENNGENEASDKNLGNPLKQIMKVQKE